MQVHSLFGSPPVSYAVASFEMSKSLSKLIVMRSRVWERARRKAGEQFRVIIALAPGVAAGGGRTHPVYRDRNGRLTSILLKNPLLSRRHLEFWGALSEANCCLWASCGEYRRRMRDELRQFPQILGGGGQ